MSGKRKYYPENISVIFMLEIDKALGIKLGSRKKPAADAPKRFNPNLKKFNVANQFRRKGMNVSIQPVSPHEQCQIKTLPQKGDAVLLMAQELAEFKRLNELAKENKRVQSTLILWNGAEESRPSAEKVPVISLEQIEKSSKKQLDWQDLCLMADHPEEDEEKPTLWKYVAAMF